MNIYAALPSVGYPHKLIPFHGSSKITRRVTALQGEVTSLFVDSGAYSAWTVGRSLDVRDYSVWARRIVGRFPEVHVASLDVIPGVKGKTPTGSELSTAMAQSLRNGDILRASGLLISEAYHFGEPIEHLYHLMERRRPGELLCIGGLVGRRAGEIRTFCDGVFHELLRMGKMPSGGYVLPPVHGFGLTRYRMMRRYPWYSCDSTTNKAPRKFGQKLTREGTEVWIEKERPERRQSMELIDYHGYEILRMWASIERETADTWERRGVVFAA